MTEYNFGEKKKEKVKNPKDQKWEELEVWQTPKYLQSKNKAIEIIEKGNYGLTEGDFWILMNRGGSKMCYTGLIISHNGCLKINSKLDKEKRFKPECAKICKDEDGLIVMEYICQEQGIYEFGEVSLKNCKNDYPYAMVLKRLQDRVILKTSEIAFFGIYSDSESEDFKESLDEKETVKEEKKNASGLSKEAGERIADDMKDTQLKANKELADRLIAKISGMGSASELEGWLEDKAVQSAYNKLEKYVTEDFARVRKAELAKFAELDPAE